METVQEIVTYPSAVAIIPIIKLSSGEYEVILVEQFRNSVKGYIHEIPAGMLEPDEDSLVCAKRELLGETGYVADKWTLVTTIYPTPGIAGETMTYFLAEGLEDSGTQHLDLTECLTVKRFPLNGLLDSMLNGNKLDGIPSVVDGKTHIAIFYLGACLKDGKL